MPDDRAPKDLFGMLAHEAGVNLSKYDQQTWSALMLQLLGVKLLKALGGEYVIEDGLPVAEFLDAKERILMDGHLEEGPLRLAIMPIPEDEQDPVAKRLLREAGLKPKQGRNEQCNCGSGRKYKKCCGRGPEFGAPV